MTTSCHEGLLLSVVVNTLYYVHWQNKGDLSTFMGFPGGLDGKECAWNAGRPGFNPWVGKISQRRTGNPLQYSCLENSMDRWAWWATVQGVAKSRTRLSDSHFDFQSFPASRPKSPFCLLTLFSAFGPSEMLRCRGPVSPAALSLNSLCPQNYLFSSPYLRFLDWTDLSRGEIIWLKQFPESSKGWPGATPRCQWYTCLPDCDTLKCLHMLPDASQGGKSAALGSHFPTDNVAISLRLETALLFFPEYACPLPSVSPPLIQSDPGRSNWKN